MIAAVVGKDVMMMTRHGIVVAKNEALRPSRAFDVVGLRPSCSQGWTRSIRCHLAMCSLSLTRWLTS